MSASSLSGLVKRLRDIMRNDAGINGDAQRIEQLAWMLFLKVYDAKEETLAFTEGDDFLSALPESCQWKNWAANTPTAETGGELLRFVDGVLFPTLRKLPGSGHRADLLRSIFAEANNYMKDGVLLRQVLNLLDAIDLQSYDETHALGEIYETILRELQSAGSAGEFYTPRAVTDFMARIIRPQIGETMADFACGTGGFITSWLKAYPEVKTPEDLTARATSVFGIEKKQFPYILAVTNLLLHDVDDPNLLHGNSLTQKFLLDFTPLEAFDVILMNPPYGGAELSAVKANFPREYQSSETADLFVALILQRLKPGGRAAVVLPDGFLFGTDGCKIALKKKLLTDFNLHTIVRLPPSVFSPYTSIATNILFFNHSGATKETWVYRMRMPEGYKHFSKTKPMRLEHFAEVEAWWNDRKSIADEQGNDLARAFTPQELAERDYNFDLCGIPSEEEEILSPAETIAAYRKERDEVQAALEASLAYLNNALSTSEPPTQRGPCVSLASTAARLVALDGAFPEAMRKALLQAAMSGALVEQRAEEGSGAELLTALRKERARLVKEKKLKPFKDLKPIEDDEKPFEIPASWQWVRLEEVVSNHGQAVPTKPFTYLDIGAVDNTRQELVADLKVLQPEKAPSRARRIVQKGDVLYATVRPYLHNVCVVNKEITPVPIASTGFAVMAAEPGCLNARYLFYCLISPMFDAYANDTENSRGMAYPAINDDRLYRGLIPLPPLAEQERIAAKLDAVLPLLQGLSKS